MTPTCAAQRPRSRAFSTASQPRIPMYERSKELFERSQRLIPGGVNSPVRAFRAVGGTPVFFREGRGARLVDEDGREYIDYVGSGGPLILGHAHPDVVAAVAAAAARGLSFGAPTALELEMAELLTTSLRSMEQVRLVSSGTEAVMGALRLPRGFTGRPTLVKFEGCYRGHSDFLLVKAGSGALTFGNPTSAGVPPEFTSRTLVLDYNDAQQVEDAFKRYGGDIAAVVLEPVAGNMNFVRPSEGFIATLREQCTRHGALLVFDEVMTGFRVGPRGAQGIFGVASDLTTLGKMISGIRLRGARRRRDRGHFRGGALRVRLDARLKMRILPSRARLAGLGLVIAMLTIVALAILVLLDLEREAQVHREVIVAQQVKDGLYALRTHVLELRAAARLGARAGDAASFRNIERRALDVEGSLASLEKLAAEVASLPAFPQLADSTRMLVIHARSIAGARQTRGPQSANALAAEAESLSGEATAALDMALAAHTQRINERTQTALALSEGLRTYIGGLLLGSIALLAGTIISHV